MKKKDLIFYAGTAVLLAFSTQQVKADEQHASDQTPENTSAIVATTSSEAQNTVSEGVGVEKGVQTENTVPLHPPQSDRRGNRAYAGRCALRLPHPAAAMPLYIRPHVLPLSRFPAPHNRPVPAGPGPRSAP